VPETVSIIGGTGALGYGLALRLARAGVSVVIGSRDADHAVSAAARASEVLPDASIDGRSNAAAAHAAELVVLAVPFRSQSETLTNLKDALRPGHVVVDATVPLAAAVSGRATRTLGVWQGSAAQQAQEMVPEGVNVVSALHTVNAATLRNLDAELDEDVLVCGDREADKQRVIDLVERVDGLRGVDCGTLEMARVTEQLRPLLIAIDMRDKTRAGIKITGV
jgi:NADPH-dependent F420 reductase